MNELFNKIRLAYLDELEKEFVNPKDFQDRNLRDWVKITTPGSTRWTEELYIAKGQPNATDRSRLGVLTFAITASIKRDSKDNIIVTINNNSSRFILPSGDIEAYWNPRLDYIFAALPKSIDPFRDKLGLFLRNLETYTYPDDVPVESLLGEFKQ